MKANEKRLSTKKEEELAIQKMEAARFKAIRDWSELCERIKEEKALKKKAKK